MHASKRPSASFFALVLLCLGSVLMMSAERPELRSRPEARAAVSSLGQGSAAVAAGILGTRAVLYARRQRGEARPAPVEAVEAAAERAEAGDRPRGV